MLWYDIGYTPFVGCHSPWEVKILLEKINVARQSIKNIIFGQDQVADLLFTALLSNGHILLESFPGLGKTKLAKSFAKVIMGIFVGFSLHQIFYRVILLESNFQTQRPMNLNYE